MKAQTDMKRLLLPTFSVLMVPANGMAHIGHVGEVAGHTHWIAVGAVVVAGTIAAILGSSKTKDEDEVIDGERQEEQASDEKAETV